MDITKLNLEQLKALAYDQVKLLNQTQHNIQVLEAEMAKRKPAPVPPLKDDIKLEDVPQG